MESELYNIFLKAPANLFDEFISECQKTFDKPAQTMLELRNRANKKIKGDKFEVFCVYYLFEVLGLENVWRLEDVPDEVLLKLNMKRRDMGIDIIGEKNGNYYAENYEKVKCPYMDIEVIEVDVKVIKEDAQKEIEIDSQDLKETLKLKKEPESHTEFFNY